MQHHTTHHAVSHIQKTICFPCLSGVQAVIPVPQGAQNQVGGPSTERTLLLSPRWLGRMPPGAHACPPRMQPHASARGNLLQPCASHCLSQMVSTPLGLNQHTNCRPLQQLYRIWAQAIVTFPHALIVLPRGSNRSHSRLGDARSEAGPQVVPQWAPGDPMTTSSHATLSHGWAWL